MEAPDLHASYPGPRAAGELARATPTSRAAATSRSARCCARARTCAAWPRPSCTASKRAAADAVDRLGRREQGLLERRSRCCATPRTAAPSADRSVAMVGAHAGAEPRAREGVRDQLAVGLPAAHRRRRRAARRRGCASSSRASSALDIAPGNDRRCKLPTAPLDAARGVRGAPRSSKPARRRGARRRSRATCATTGSDDPAERRAKQLAAARGRARADARAPAARGRAGRAARRADALRAQGRARCSRTTRRRCCCARA